MPRVYIGRLSYHVREKDIQRFFSGYGKLMEIDLKNGYGFVEFEDNRDADDAVYELNGKELCGERVIVEHARGPRRDRDGYGGGYWGGGRSSGYSSRSRSGRDKYGPPVRTEYRLIVENLSSRCSWQDLKDFMRQAGEVTYADAHKERTNEGVIEFRSHSDMKRALDKLDGTDINGRKIRLVEDRPRRTKVLLWQSAPDLVVAVAPAAGAAGATEAGAPGVVPDPTPDLVPAATKDVVIPAPDLEGSLAPSQEKASRALATAGPVLDPANPSLVHTRANPAPVQPTINPSPAQRAAQR
ncbi:hypothetical protein E3U43_014205 [Larimichthys crocea]|uniref:Uncharacterized protein n=1 Tax=Larimichthys crocea TaxID=215358 RepID=A0ACD3RBF0_LARCR|nr:hypothetical protein E3U43_014205 [Larimichthys crocea]